MADVSVLYVYLYGEPIGTLTRVAGDRTLFAFDEAYVADTAARPEPRFQGCLRRVDHGLSADTDQRYALLLKPSAGILKGRRS